MPGRFCRYRRSSGPSGEVVSNGGRRMEFGFFSTHNSSITPTDSITRDTGLGPGRSFPSFLGLLLGGLGSWDVGEVGTSGLGAARDDHGLFVDQADQGSPRHAADEHAAIDEVVGG